MQFYFKNEQPLRVFADEPIENEVETSWNYIYIYIYTYIYIYSVKLNLIVFTQIAKKGGTSFRMQDKTNYKTDTVSGISTISI